MLEKAWKGLNNTIFAYGQTGSGKSYTTFGYGADRGIIPMAADKIFERIRGNTDPNIAFTVKVQMVEIYLEKIQDLLVPLAEKGKKELEVRSTAKEIWVEGAKNLEVMTYEQIDSTIKMGESNKSIAATNMNKTSSRAHTVVTIKIVKVTTFNGKKSQTESTINIVDLAGSEK